jgi:hypothetical protein
MNSQLPNDLQNLLTELDRELETIGTEYPAQLDAEPAPATIYHYTDDNGLKGIIESGTLWCSDVFYLNDPSELRYGVSIATDMVTALHNGSAA